MIIANKKFIQELIDKSIQEFEDNSHLEINVMNDLNKLNFSRENGIIYMIFSDEQLKYVGKSKGKYFRNRVKNHLIKQDKKTNSKLKFVKNERLENNKVTIKFIEINPESLRNLIEELLIEKFKNNNIWNNNTINKELNIRKA